ncbi:prepilin peptidase [Cupriavidus sp. 2SB]|uniref:prepilin peptidase n=1 Tax=Cupriavidus sp. 2SB TaxID=2502199 RepID=UPI0010F63B7B|nr:prepilin peptidase [Cupriavidus sp. 2SB]
MITFAALANLGLAAMVVVAAVSDAHSRRIPNALVAAGLVAALGFQIAALGFTAGAWQWIGGLATGMGLFLAIYLFGGLGAGDVKLMGAAGAFLGPLGAAHAALASFLVGGLLALAAMLLHRPSRQALTALGSLLMALPFGRTATTAARIDPASEAGSSATARLPYAIAIAAGVLLVKWEVL